MQLSVILASLLAGAAFAAPGSKKDLRSCVERVLGANAKQRIVVPTDDTYTDARIGESIQFTQLPALIAYAEKTSEVGDLVQCAKKNGIKAVPRNGGHHFVAYSVLTDTLVIDLTHIDTVTISADRSSAAVGSGIRFGALLTALGKQNLTWTSGICPTVGLSGFLSAGGFNMQMRQLGMGVDNVLAAKVVLADGRTVTASPSQNADLFFAIRGGGGGTYGIVVEWTLKMFTFPRSAMVYIQWNEPGTRYDVAKAFHEWGPKADPALTSQVNLYKNRTEVLGWCLGCSAEKLQAMVDQSGLAAIGKPTVWLSGGCNTDNARMFGYVVTQCLPDEVVAQYAPLVLNTVQQPFIKVGNYSQFTYNEHAQAPAEPLAQPWLRFRRIAKSFIVQKQNLISDDTMKNLISRLDLLPDEALGWIEWHAWNITAKGDAAFAWREQAYSHFEIIATSSMDESVHQGYMQWFADLEAYIRPIVGPASYAGYMDDKISSPPLESYYGSNVKRLSQIKKRYDPNSFFTNPLSIPPSQSCDK